MKAWERRHAILETLCIRRYDTRANLAFEFGVCKRTIEYDVSELSLTYPIYTVQGRGGGIYIIDGFYLNKPRLNVKEVELMLRILPTLNGEDNKIMYEIIKKYGWIKK